MLTSNGLPNPPRGKPTKLSALLPLTTYGRSSCTPTATDALPLTGASAVCVAGALSGRTDRKILAHLPGGDLELRWADDDHVFMTGPAEEVFTGELAEN